MIVMARPRTVPPARPDEYRDQRLFIRYIVMGGACSRESGRFRGGCQQWWIGPVLGGLSQWPLMLAATALTAFNDDAAITYLTSLVPGFSDVLKYVVMAGAVTGGGLTVIANSPNPAGQSILASRFGEAGNSPLYLFLGALLPTLIAGAAFMFLL
jgi:putative Na+/H+ antiporter